MCCPLLPSLTEAAARFLKTLIHSPQVLNTTICPRTLCTPVFIHSHLRLPHQHIFPPSQWRLRYVTLYLRFPAAAGRRAAPRLHCDKHANMPTAREVRFDMLQAQQRMGIDTAIARLSSPGFANRLSVTMVCPRALSATAAHANSVTTEMVTYMKVCHY